MGRTKRQEDREIQELIRSLTWEQRGELLVEMMLRRDPAKLVRILEASMRPED